MADFFKQNDEKEVEEKPKEKEQTYKLGDKTYSQDELSQLVGLGEMAREAEEKYNTKLDKVYPKYTKTTQELKREREEKEKLKNMLEEKQTMSQRGITEEQKREAVEAARTLGIVTKDDMKQFLDQYFNEQFPSYYSQQRAADNLLDKTNSLEKEIDGKDGRPAFKQREMLEYMKEVGERDPIWAYRKKYKKELDKWEAGKLRESKSDSGFATIDKSSAGAKQPKPVKATKDNLRQLLRERLYRS